MSDTPSQESAILCELPVDGPMIGLLREAILMRRRALELEFASCRQQIERIERRYGLPRSALAEAIGAGTLEITPSEARLWFTELLALKRLRQDIERLARIRLVQQAADQQGLSVGSLRPAA